MKVITIILSVIFYIMHAQVLFASQDSTQKVDVSDQLQVVPYTPLTLQLKRSQSYQEQPKLYPTMQKQRIWRTQADLNQPVAFYNKDNVRMYLSSASHAAANPPIFEKEFPKSIRKIKSYDQLNRLFPSTIMSKDQDIHVKNIREVQIPDRTKDKESKLTLDTFAQTAIEYPYNSTLYLPAPDSYSQDLATLKKVGSQDLIKKIPSSDSLERPWYPEALGSDNFLYSSNIQRPYQYQAVRAQGLRRSASEPIKESRALCAADSTQAYDLHHEPIHNQKTGCIACLASCYYWITKCLR